jgi:manganese-dependent ADP-ribose/CDP-alcohol diphosphatase
MIRRLAYILTLALLLASHLIFAQTKDKPLFTFGIITDVQYADQDNAGTRHYRLSPKKLAEAVDSFNLYKPQFVLSLGDYIDKNFSSYDTLNPITERLTMHLYHTLGNHEFSVNDNEKERVLQKENLEKPYYSFEKNNWRFVIINGNDVSLHAHIKGSSEYKEAEALLVKLKADSLRQAQTWNGAIGKEQLEWLEKELLAAQNKKQKVIMACHFPLYPDGATELLWNAKEIRALIEKYRCVFAYVNGHVHKSQYFFEKGVHYVSFRGMVELDDNAFAMITVYPDRLEIKGFGKELSHTLK